MIRDPRRSAHACNAQVTPWRLAHLVARCHVARGDWVDASVAYDALLEQMNFVVRARRGQAGGQAWSA